MTSIVSRCHFSKEKKIDFFLQSVVFYRFAQRYFHQLPKMPPKPLKNPKEVNPRERVIILHEQVGALTNRLNACSVREIVNNGIQKKLLSEKNADQKKLANMEENLMLNEIEAKLATSCVNTQYKLLQRLFILRLRESKETIANLRNENLDLKAQSETEIGARDRQIAEKDEQIRLLETHLNSLHFQLERVVLEMAEKFEKRIEEDRLSWEKEADQFHVQATKMLKKFDLCGHFM